MSQLWSQLQFFLPTWLDVLQILIVAFLLFRVLLIIQRTRAMQILLGVLVIAVAYLLSQVLRLTLIEYLLSTLLQYGAIAALVVFQPELRTALSRLGQGSRVILTHDVAQRDNLRVGRRDGIASVVASLRGHELFAHVSLNRSERSAIAALVSDALDID